MFDDSLDDLARVRTYTSSKIALQRLVHVKLLTNVANEFPFAGLVTDLFPTLERLVNDEEFVIRQHLAEQIRGLADVCAKKGGEEGYRILAEQLLFHLGKLVADNMAEVRPTREQRQLLLCSVLALIPWWQQRFCVNSNDIAKVYCVGSGWNGWLGWELALR